MSIFVLVVLVIMVPRKSDKLGGELGGGEGQLYLVCAHESNSELCSRFEVLCKFVKWKSTGIPRIIALATQNVEIDPSQLCKEY